MAGVNFNKDFVDFSLASPSTQAIIVIVEKVFNLPVTNLIEME